jgi:uncharacterized protein (DUF4415 family)
MNNKEDIDFSEENFKRRFKQIRRKDRPKATQNILKNVSLRECKSRITIHLDADIVSYYKEMAENSPSGYQTLINQTLREIVDGQRQPQTSDLKNEILHDKQFLHELKEALEV